MRVKFSLCLFVPYTVISVIAVVYTLSIMHFAPERSGEGMVAVYLIVLGLPWSLLSIAVDMVLATIKSPPPWQFNLSNFVHEVLMIVPIVVNAMILYFVGRALDKERTQAKVS